MITIFEKGMRISIDDICKLEESIGFSIPDTYKLFLIENNGGHPEPNGIDIKGISHGETDIAWFMGINRNIESSNILFVYNLIKDSYDRKILPIASDSFGGLFCIDMEMQNEFPIVYIEWGASWEKGAYNPLFVASGFETFLKIIHE